jgi:type IV fimbrial biogenesis protein FimT
MKHSAERGVSLIELAIGMTILGLFVTQAVPSFNAFLINQRIRAAAEAMTSMLQRARVEAIQRNQEVEFVTFDRLISTTNASYAGLITAVAGGDHWVLRTKDGAGNYFAIASRSSAETSTESGSGRISYQDANNVRQSSTQIRATSTVPGVTFNALGATSNIGSTATFDFIRHNPNNASAYQCAQAGGPIRCLRVTVSSAGQVRVCDPAVTASADTRKC